MAKMNKGDKIYYDDGEIGVIEQVYAWGYDVLVEGSIASVHHYDAELLNKRNAPNNDFSNAREPVVTIDAGSGPKVAKPVYVREMVPAWELSDGTIVLDEELGIKSEYKPDK